MTTCDRHRDRDYRPRHHAPAQRPVPFVDGDGAALEGEEHLARRGRGDLDVDDGALLELCAEYVRVMLDDAALVDAGNPAFVLVADPQAAVGVDGDGAHVVRE